MEKNTGAFRTISEVSLELDVPQHVLRFWEQKFSQIKPLKRGGGRRYYRPGDVDLIRSIRQLLYAEGYTIRGVQRLLKTQGIRSVASGATFDREQGLAAEPDEKTAGFALAEADAEVALELPAEPFSAHDRHRLTVLLDEVRSCAARLRSVQSAATPCRPFAAGQSDEADRTTFLSPSQSKQAGA